MHVSHSSPSHIFSGDYLPGLVPLSHISFLGSYTSGSVCLSHNILISIKWLLVRLSARLSLTSHVGSYTPGSVCPSHNHTSSHSSPSSYITILCESQHNIIQCNSSSTLLLIIFNKHSKSQIIILIAIHAHSYHIKWLAHIGANIHYPSQHMPNRPFSGLTTIYSYIHHFFS